MKILFKYYMVASFNYCFYAFINNDLNAQNWSVEMKLFFFISTILSSIYLINKNNEKH